MLHTKPFYDLCVGIEAFRPENCKTTLKSLHEFGYRTIAINQYVKESDFHESKKKKKKGEPRENADPVPTPVDVQQFDQFKKELCIEDLTVLNRLTVTFAKVDILHTITKSPIYKKYDIIAANPTTQVAFQFCCNTLEADILTFHPENKQAYRLTRKLYNLLVDRGYHFELIYGCAITDSSMRKNLIHAAHNYHCFGKSKNVIFSSGAQDSFNIRSPYDVISLGFIFGLSTAQCKQAVAANCRALCLSSVGRRQGKSVFFVSKSVEPESIKDSSETVVLDSDDEDMDTDQPALKKSKQ